LTTIGLGPVTSPGLLRVWDALPQARLVGGVVRDLLAGRAVTDIDLATPEPPEDVQQRLVAAGIKAVPTGIAHGTVTAVVDGQPFEITTLRRDVETDGRHARVAWTTDWREDAARRDFTINAMSCDRDGVVFDAFGGVRDLAAGRVRFVGDAAERIAEDALRVLRFFRFFARYGAETPDAEALHAIGMAADRLGRLSAERVWSELSRILAAPRAGEMMVLMEDAGVLAAVVPSPVTVARLLALLACGAPPDPVLRLAALSGAPASDLSRALRLSGRDRGALAALPGEPRARPGMAHGDIAQVLAVVPPDTAVRRTWLDQAATVGAPDAAWDAVRAALRDTPRPVFPLAGRDAVALGVGPGAQVGVVLRRVEARWLAGGCVADRAMCLKWLREAAE